MTTVQFDFGENWKNYSSRALNHNKIIEARESLLRLLSIKEIENKNIVDIGCGSGIFSIAFALLGTKRILGIDINKKSIEVSLKNLNFFSQSFHLRQNIEFRLADILKSASIKNEKFDIVYSWGALHHTGDMYKALDAAISLMSNNGYLIIALYNKHWSSIAWKFIKYFYNISPYLIKKNLAYFFYPIIFTVKLMITGKNPLKNDRGMDFYYNIIDWIGGYPYEYATKQEIENYLMRKGLVLLKFIPPSVPTGCNEFVFKKHE